MKDPSAVKEVVEGHNLEPLAQDRACLCSICALGAWQVSEEAVRDRGHYRWHHRDIPQVSMTLSNENVLSR